MLQWWNGEIWNTISDMELPSISSYTKTPSPESLTSNLKAVCTFGVNVSPFGANQGIVISDTM